MLLDVCPDRTVCQILGDRVVLDRVGCSRGIYSLVSLVFLSGWALVGCCWYCFKLVIRTLKLALDLMRTLLLTTAFFALFNAGESETVLDVVVVSFSMEGTTPVSKELDIVAVKELQLRWAELERRARADGRKKLLSG